MFLFFIFRVKLHHTNSLFIVFLVFNVGDQCKKLYENKRTRLGKILNKEKKSGSGQTNRTTRDDEIVNTWGFLKQHIVRGKTTASDTFDREGEVHEREDDEVSIMSVSEDMDNETLIPLKDRVPKSARSEASGTSGSRTPASRSSTVLQNNLDDALRQVLSRADNLGQTAALTGQKKIVHDFACLLEGHMQKIPEESWHSFQIECLQLVHNFKQPTRPTQPCQQQPSSWQSNQWPINSHWSNFNQWSPASPSFNNVGMPAAPSAVPVPIPTSSQQSTASTPPSRRSNEMVSSVLEELGEEK
ncbi:uncharacterized protein LOC115929139 isoform X1 [Strongylocentrotus purpuratus]|uniref:Uncharacterized protein n=2 Tax=Strongylocentrotus purpuratus TaxID=7668 RepID=A0A7M7PRA4_STRPU|nr:uncharacterized protein LOC115929139 isoform X1 [Strongylocentrotus purpuratus]